MNYKSATAELISLLPYPCFLNQTKSGKAICGHNVGMNVANKIAFYNNTSNNLITIHNYGIRIWDVDYEKKKILFQDLTMGQIKRIYQCIVIAPDDSCATWEPSLATSSRSASPEEFSRELAPATTSSLRVSTVYSFSQTVTFWLALVTVKLPSFRSALKT